MSITVHPEKKTDVTGVMSVEEERRSPGYRPEGIYKIRHFKLEAFLFGLPFNSPRAQLMPQHI